jgi:hypothetical protein
MIVTTLFRSLAFCRCLWDAMQVDETTGKLLVQSMFSAIERTASQSAEHFQACSLNHWDIFALESTSCERSGPAFDSTQRAVNRLARRHAAG